MTKKQRALEIINRLKTGGAMYGCESQYDRSDVI